jgi:hypothetical protein
MPAKKLQKINHRRFLNILIKVECQKNYVNVDIVKDELLKANYQV